MKYPNKLKEQRQRSRLSQAEVAKMLDITVAAVSRHENGNRQLSRDLATQYARLYKISAAELFVDLDTTDSYAEDTESPTLELVPDPE